MTDPDQPKQPEQPEHSEQPTPPGEPVPAPEPPAVGSAVPAGPDEPAPVPAPAPAAGMSSGRKLAIVIAGGVVALLVVIAGAIGVYAFLHDSPSDAADKWLSALKDGDFADMKDLSCGEAKEFAAFLAEASPEDRRFLTDAFKDTSWEVTDERTNGKKADVQVKVTSKAADGKVESATSVLKLEDQDGWKVCDFDDNIGGSTPI